MSIAAGAALWGRNPLADSRREAILTSSRRIEGDVMVLSLDNPPPQDFNQIYGLTAHAAGVIDASVVAISEVQIESAAMPSSALLELRSLHNSRGSLPNFPGSVPSARSADLPPELAVGRLLAKRLRVEAGDSVTLWIPAGAGTTGLVRKVCKVVSIAAFGLDHYDERLMIADITHLSNFALIPTGLSLQLGSSDTRSQFAIDLQRGLGARWRVIPLEELVAPLLKSDR